MKRYVNYNLLSGEVLSVTELSDPEQLQYQEFPKGTYIMEDSEANIGDYILDNTLISRHSSPNPLFKYNITTKSWVDPRTLEDMKASKWKEIKDARSSSELGGFKFEGKVFNSTLSDQIKINGLLNTITINPTHTEKWYAQDNSHVLLTKENISSFSSKLTQHISYVYKVAGDLRIMINNCTSKKELDQLIWPL